MPRNQEGEPAVVVGKTYDFVLWLLPKVEKFARSYRLSAGDRLVSNGLDLLLILVEAAYSKIGRSVSHPPSSIPLLQPVHLPFSIA